MDNRPNADKTVLFIGTSVLAHEIPGSTEFEIHPPVKRGDLEKLQLSEADSVIIVDGEFGQNLSVSPKEILKLLERNITVYGASSMGALRAVELNMYGMIGSGWVYRAYQSGAVTRDDEVALLYHPANYTPLTVPLINIRYWLSKLLEIKALTALQANKILHRLGKLYFGDRSIDRIENVVDTVLNTGSFCFLKAVTNGEISDIKKLDAINLLKSLRRINYER
jgi:hypothetical protein